jgi:DNA-binding CsgD family transcriptional regulator
MLEGLGLDRDTEQVYREMLRDPTAGVARIVAELGLPESTVRGALDALARLALLRPSWDDPDTLVPVSPDVGLTSLLSKEQQVLAARQQQIEASRTAVAALVADYADMRPRQPDPDVERLIGAEAVAERLEHLARHATTETLSLLPGGAQSATSLHASRPLDEGALQRGIRLRTVYLDSMRNDAATLAYAHWLTELGGEVRTNAVLPMRMFVVDREVAVVPMPMQAGGVAAILLRSPALIVGLCALFDGIWKGATPLHARRRARDTHGLTSQERAILGLLGDGHTDEVIARRLAVSVRTCRRVIADLMERLDARSRFQAGVLAQAGGWLDGD